jgi:hypothetical protein
MFGRQWFEPGSQVALEDDALIYEALVRKRLYAKAFEFVNYKLDSTACTKSHCFWLRQRQRVRQLQMRNHSTSVIRVAFSGFWPSFEPDDNELLNIVRHAASLAGFIVQIDYSNPDLLLFSCFGEPQPNEYLGATRLLYLGENVRPDYRDTDYSLTFDMSDYCERNIYLPLWLLRSTKYCSKSSDYQPYDMNQLEQPRNASGHDDAVVYIGNNSTPMRLEAIRELERLGVAVDCYGSQTRPVSNKINTLLRYRYSLCFENSFTPGYVTEKIVDSFMGGSFPIYWGGAPQEIFNLTEYFICNPYQSFASNMRDFIAWRNSQYRMILPPLLRQGAAAKTDANVLAGLARIIMDLF